MKIILLLIITNGIFSLNKNPKESTLKTTFSTIKGLMLGGLETYFGLEAKIGNSLNMEINFGFNEIIIGDKEKVKWGIKCEESVNNCKINSDELKEDFYYSHRYLYKEASVYQRFFENSPIEKTDENLKVRLVEENQFWKLGDWGVLGLGPQGKFGNYLRNSYENDSSFVLSYNYDKNRDLQFKAILNSNVESDILVKVDLAKEKKIWLAQGKVNIFENYNYENEICFSSYSNNILNVLDALEICHDIRNLVCPPAPGSCSSEQDVNYKNAPQINFTINEKLFSFSGKDYIYFNKKNQFKCLIGTLDDEKDFGYCPENSNLGVGKAFFTKYPVELKFKKDGSSSLALLFKLDINYIWILIGAVAALAGVIVILFVCCRKNEDEEKEEYTKQENA